jgi:collagen type III alpha
MRASLVGMAIVAVFAGVGDRLFAADSQPAAPGAKAENAKKGADSTPLNIEDPRALFDQLDVNHDGKLTADEIPAEKKRLFERLLRLAGKSADGHLTRDEFVGLLKGTPQDQPEPDTKPANGTKPGSATPAPTPKKPATTTTAKPAGKKNKQFEQLKANPGKVFDRLDKNGTGKLAADDVPDRLQKLFKRLLKQAGKPEDGTLTRDEFIAAVEKIVAKQEAKAVKTPANSSDSNSGAAPASPGAASGGVDVNKLVARIMERSKRADGKLTKDDLPERLQARFEKIDANSDGVVDAGELRDWLTKVKRRAEMLEKQLPAATTPANP